MKFDFNKEVKGKDPDMSDEAQEFYKEYFSWSQKCGMRGDTICSFSTCFGARNKKTNSNLEPLIDGRIWKRAYTYDIFNDCAARQWVLEYRIKYHSLANFWVMPATLNTWRGKEDRNRDLPAQGDFFDIFLGCIRNFYLDNESNPISVQYKFKEDIVEKWLHSFGTSHNGWKNFIEQNYLDMFIVKDTYEVKDLFGDKFQSSNAELLGTYHTYGRALPQHTIKQAPMVSAKNFLNNSLWAIGERSLLLIKKPKVQILFCPKTAIILRMWEDLNINSKAYKAPPI